MLWSYIGKTHKEQTHLELHTEPVDPENGAAFLSETAPCNAPQHRDISIGQRYGQQKTTGLPGPQKTKVETVWNKKRRDDRWHDVDRSDSNWSTEGMSRQYFD